MSAKSSIPEDEQLALLDAYACGRGFVRVTLDGIKRIDPRDIFPEPGQELEGELLNDAMRERLKQAGMAV